MSLSRLTICWSSPVLYQDFVVRDLRGDPRLVLRGEMRILVGLVVGPAGLEQRPTDYENDPNRSDNQVTPSQLRFDLGS
jgi:hypothetical protein